MTSHAATTTSKTGWARVTLVSVLVALCVWGVLFAVFATRRWLCPPWQGACGANFVEVLETSVLFLWVSERETLLSGVMAVGAAIAGAYLLNKQVRQSDQQERERTDRSYRAARAMAPLVLTEVCDFAEQTAEQWLLLKSHLALVELAPNSPPVSLDFPRISPTGLDDIRKIVQFAPPKESEYYTSLIRDIQVRVARARDAARQANDEQRRPDNLYIASEVVEVAELYASASALFDFAREEGQLPDSHKPTREEVRSALRSLRLNSDFDDDIWEAFERRYPPPPRI
ncbi:hypothetical protein SAMN05192570_0811 [Brevundimonas viscosa]|uniref:Uncharacterized protein n=1 Tax=Brevundimonas viscosa TaxID=871741 RepID=A0A1I6P430_9CAUL|nr:hypothetical protein SAMN05192570_0811 [Brevundimonas viscosa]